MDLGEMIRRRRRGLTNADIARRVGISDSAIWNMVNRPGLKNFSDPNTLVGLCEVLRVDLISLIRAEAESIPNPRLHALIPPSVSEFEYRPGTLDGAVDEEVRGLAPHQRRLLRQFLTASDALQGNAIELVEVVCRMLPEHVEQVLVLCRTIEALNTAMNDRAHGPHELTGRPEPATAPRPRRTKPAPEGKPARRQRIVGQAADVRDEGLRRGRRQRDGADGPAA